MTALVVQWRSSRGRLLQAQVHPEGHRMLCLAPPSHGSLTASALASHLGKPGPWRGSQQLCNTAGVPAVSRPSHRGLQVACLNYHPALDLATVTGGLFALCDRGWAACSSGKTKAFPGQGDREVAQEETAGSISRK